MSEYDAYCEEHDLKLNPDGSCPECRDANGDLSPWTCSPITSNGRPRGRPRRATPPELWGITTLSLSPNRSLPSLKLSTKCLKTKAVPPDKIPPFPVYYVRREHMADTNVMSQPADTPEARRAKIDAMKRMILVKRIEELEEKK
jgi:hypothetical protein